MLILIAWSAVVEYENSFYFVFKSLKIDLKNIAFISGVLNVQ